MPCKADLHFADAITLITRNRIEQSRAVQTRAERGVKLRKSNIEVYDKIVELFSDTSHQTASHFTKLNHNCHYTPCQTTVPHEVLLSEQIVCLDLC